MIARHKLHGFTLPELAIALSIIALLAVSIFVGGSSMIEQSERKAAIKMAADIRAAVLQFKEQFRFLPGDFPAVDEIPNLLGDCRSGGGGVGNGDGLINFNAAPSESSCANDHLFKSGFYAKDAFVPKSGAVRILSRTAAVARFAAVKSSAPVNNVRDTVRNVILFEDVPCSVAAAVDEAFDDNALNNNTGLVASLSGACTGSASIWFVVAL
jgi:prepilin-type N-terminal cleavage/methylation domain-containing protein